MISIAGRYLMQDGKRFVVKGVVYQRSARDGKPTDPLADQYVDDIRRDIDLFKDLGLNALFVYNVDAKLSHDESMSMLASAGIHVIALASDPNNREVINRMAPRQSYNSRVQSHFQAGTACMARYSNTIGVCISNELINDYSQKQDLIHETCEVLAQATLELKRYMQAQHAENGQRILPVGIADNFWTLTHTTTFEYLTRPEKRDERPDSRLDFYCVNHYARTNPGETEVGQSAVSPWNTIHTLPQFHDESNEIPILLSEYSSSCVSRPRPFQETTDLYTATPPPGTDMPMLDVLSGGFVYEFFEHVNQYGLVKVHDHGKTIEKLPDYTSLKSRLDAIDRT